MSRFVQRSSRSARSGGISQGCLIALAAVVLVLLVVGGVTVGKYNGLVSRQENVEAKWSEIDNQHKRRFDLVPNLVKTVQGAADFEASTLQAVVEARASVSRAALPEGLPSDPEKLQAYVKAQQGLGSALGRLFAVAEQYPQLRATQGFLALQDQLEGTENRIAVARRDYIDSVRDYNTGIRKFPANLLAGMFGFEKVPQLEVETEVREVPEVDFGK